MDLPVITSSLEVNANTLVGNVDELNNKSVSGWVLDRLKPRLAVGVLLSLGGHDIAFAKTSGERIDVEDYTGIKNISPGFHIDFNSEEILANIEVALAQILADNESEIAQLDTIASSLKVIVVSNQVGVLDARHELCFKGGPFRQTLREWVSFFDLTAEQIQFQLDRLSGRAGVTPKRTLTDQKPLAIAFYLPQFYPCPENDRWWGKGFTEWTNVSKAKSYFEGHSAPNLPADLGFYDIRLEEVRREQGELAKKYGIFGFCYYFYWFNGKRLLEKSLDAILNERQPDMPFCLCWANETWSRRWDGSEKEILIEQKHNAETDAEIIEDLEPFFRDNRYIKIDNRPLFIIYRPSLMKDPARFIENLRKKSISKGLGNPFICTVLSFGAIDPREFGGDFAIEFPPHAIDAEEIDRKDLSMTSDFKGIIYSYESVVEHYVDSVRPFPYFPGVMPRWDNTARKGESGHLYHGSTPQIFSAWLKSACNKTLRLNPKHPLVFINSWNEWGEGAHLEPDFRFGRRYLEAARSVLSGEYFFEHNLIEREYSEDLVKSLINENIIVSARLQKTNQLLGLASPVPGLPPGYVEGKMTVAMAGHLDIVNGKRPEHTVAVSRDTGLILIGWCIPGGQHQHAMSVILTLLKDGNKYFYPVSIRYPRDDVSSKYGSNFSDINIGFEVRVNCESLPSGFYNIDVVAVDDKNVYMLDLEQTLVIL